jgi:uncharacterized protein (TIGR01777 family)
MKIALTGATGFIGEHLSQQLLAASHQLHFVGRRPPPALDGRFFPWKSTHVEPPADAFEGVDAVIHLAGEPVAQRWNEDVKRRIRDSRVIGTQRLVETLSRLNHRPRALIAASAVGYYGSRGDEILTESSTPGSDFLGRTCVEWENAVTAARDLDLRVAMIRIGIVLGTGGGALAKMLPPFRLGAGGRLGDGQQWMSWIHLEDLTGLFRFALVNDVSGPWNGTAPHPARNEGFTRQLAAALHRPAIFPVPALALRALYGEMADILLGGQRVLPQAAEAAGFPFRYPELKPALAAILG